jgi:signal transduction histidine kinase
MIALFGVVMVSLVQLTLRSGRTQDAASLEAQVEAAATGAAETAERQRTRYQEFTRNDVIATLHEASINGPDAAESGARAALALAKMDEFRNDYPTPSVLDPEEFESLLRTEELADVPIGFTVAPQRDGRILIPADVADALAEAFAEAVRNSVRHAGASDRPVLRRARVNVTPGGVDIVVSDDGRGFAVSRMPLDRFGVRVGILQRINSLDGGTATVESSPRGGTTVTLSWQKEAVSL